MYNNNIIQHHQLYLQIPTTNQYQLQLPMAKPYFHITSSTCIHSDDNNLFCVGNSAGGNDGIIIDDLMM